MQILCSARFKFETDKTPPRPKVTVTETMTKTKMQIKATKNASEKNKKVTGTVVVTMEASSDIHTNWVTKTQIQMETARMTIVMLRSTQPQKFANPTTHWRSTC